MAKVAANKNPYAAREEIVNTPPEYNMPNMAFAAPSESIENGTLDSPIGAYSDTLLEQPGHTPDPMRIGRMPARDRRPDPTRAPEEFWDRLDADDEKRHSVEMQDADGWEENKGILRRFAPNPRSIPGPEPRPTARLAPRSYIFTRPAWGGPRELSGEHFSMADHRRDYPILGTQPVRTWRNTYRISPAPWDADMVDDAPNDPTDVPAGRIQSVEVPLTHNWRL